MDISIVIKSILLLSYLVSVMFYFMLTQGQCKNCGNLTHDQNKRRCSSDSKISFSYKSVKKLELLLL